MSKPELKAVGKGWYLNTRESSLADDLAVIRNRKLPAKVYSIAEMAKRLSCGADVLYEAIRKGDLYAWRVGRQYRVSDETINEWVEWCTRKKRRA